MFFFSRNAASTWPPNYRGVSYSVASHRAARHTLVVCGQLDAIKHFLGLGGNPLNEIPALGFRDTNFWAKK